MHIEIYGDTCRTYVCSNINGEEGPEGRGNIAPITLNLTRVGIEADNDLSKFWNILDERLMLCRKAILHRKDTLAQLKVKDLPFALGEHLVKGSENLGPEDTIEPVLLQGTWAIGFVGLAETLVALIGQHHGESEEARELGLQIITHIREFCDKYTKEDKLNYGCYATPAESTINKFALSDRRKFGVIRGVTDKDYYTNSYHVPVGFNISAIDKIKIEAPYHSLCNSGHISYVEFDDYPTEETILKLIQFLYTETDVDYMGINFHIRYCKKCGKLLKETDTNCTECGCEDIVGISRVTGYLSFDERFGPGKVAERRDRIAHDTGNRNYTSLI